VAKNHERWTKLIKKGQATPEDELPELPRSKKPTPTQNTLIDLLMIVLQIQAKELGITAAAIASRKQIANMIQSGNTSLSDDWRGAIVNELFDDIISGNKIVRVDNRKVIVESP
jgi:ribonuclease D